MTDKENRPWTGSRRRMPLSSALPRVLETAGKAAVTPMSAKRNTDRGVGSSADNSTGGVGLSRREPNGIPSSTTMRGSASSKHDTSAKRNTSAKCDAETTMMTPLQRRGGGSLIRGPLRVRVGNSSAGSDLSLSFWPKPVKDGGSTPSIAAAVTTSSVASRKTPRRAAGTSAVVAVTGAAGPNQSSSKTREGRAALGLENRSLSGSPRLAPAVAAAIALPVNATTGRANGSADLLASTAGTFAKEAKPGKTGPSSSNIPVGSATKRERPGGAVAATVAPSPRAVNTKDVGGSASASSKEHGASITVSTKGAAGESSSSDYSYILNWKPASRRSPGGGSTRGKEHAAVATATGIIAGQAERKDAAKITRADHLHHVGEQSRAVSSSTGVAGAVATTTASLTTSSSKNSSNGSTSGYGAVGGADSGTTTEVSAALDAAKKKDGEEDGHGTRDGGGGAVAVADDKRRRAAAPGQGEASATPKSTTSYLGMSPALGALRVRVSASGSAGRIEEDDEDGEDDTLEMQVC